MHRGSCPSSDARAQASGDRLHRGVGAHALSAPAATADGSGTRPAPDLTAPWWGSMRCLCGQTRGAFRQDQVRGAMAPGRTTLRRTTRPGAGVRPAVARGSDAARRAIPCATQSLANAETPRVQRCALSRASIGTKSFPRKEIVCAVPPCVKTQGVGQSGRRGLCGARPAVPWTWPRTSLSCRTAPRHSSAEAYIRPCASQ